jgi:hypothetical protein
MSGVKPERAATAAAGRSRERARWVVGTLLAAAVLMLCYLRIAGDTQVNSDGAGMVLQAWDMLHGNVLLHGWWATDVSFYTTELPEYMVVTAAAGLRPEVVHIASALTYTMLVLLTAFVARGRARGAEGLVRALLAAGLILAPQPTGPTLVILGNPDHVGTGVPVLLLLLLLDWAPGRQAQPRWWVPVAAAVLLAWSMIGDPLIEVVGVAPLFIACALRAAWVIRSRRAPDSAAPGGGGPSARGRLRAACAPAWYELSLAGAALAALVLAKAGNWLIRELGGFNMAGPAYSVQSLHEIVKGLPVVWESVLVLFDADYTDVHGAGNVAFALVHLIGVAVVAVAFVVAARGILARLAGLVRPRPTGAGASPGDLVTDFLVIGIAVSFAAFLLEVKMENAYSSHEIAPVLAFGAALAGRTLGSRILGRKAPAADGAPADQVPDAGQAQADGPPAARPARTGARRLLLPAFAVVLACYVAMLGIATGYRNAAPRNVGLTAWLLQHHLTSGLSPYWEATSITLDSGGAITMVSVVDGGAHGHVTPQRWLTDPRLAVPAPGRSASFVILSPAEKVRRSAVLATFGKPAGSYSYGPYTILIWHKNLLPPMARSAKPPRTRTDSVTRPGGAAGVGRPGA